MTDTNEGTTATAPEAQSDDSTAQADDALATGTQTQPDEVTTLRSRNAGLDAKVTKLSSSLKAERERAEELQKKLDEYISGKANEDSDTRALLQRLNEELNTERTRAKVASLAVKYPESYGVLGDAIANMAEDQLEAAEARFRGVAAESNTPPPPVGNNAARPAPGSKPIEDMSLAELKEYGRQQFSGTRWADIEQT